MLRARAALWSNTPRGQADPGLDLGLCDGRKGPLDVFAGTVVKTRGGDGHYTMLLTVLEVKGQG